jgi:hypothetical protein
LVTSTNSFATESSSPAVTQNQKNLTQQVTFNRGGLPVLRVMDVSGIGDFYLQLICQPSGTSSGWRGVICKYTVLLFPVSAAELANTVESQFAGFPGLKISDGHFLLGPAAATKWKCPIIPFIHPCRPLEENDNAPSSTRL